MTLELTLEEAKALLHAIIRTSAKNTIFEGSTEGVLDLVEKLEDRLVVLINKPVETTNEQPIEITCNCSEKRRFCDC